MLGRKIDDCRYPFAQLQLGLPRQLDHHRSARSNLRGLIAATTRPDGEPRSAIRSILVLNAVLKSVQFGMPRGVREQVLVTSDRGIWHSIGERCPRGPVSHSRERIDPKQAICLRYSEAVAEGDLAEVASVRGEDVVALGPADMATVTGPQVLAIKIAKVLAAPSPQVRHGLPPKS